MKTGPYTLDELKPLRIAFKDHHGRSLSDFFRESEQYQMLERFTNTFLEREDQVEIVQWSCDLVFQLARYGFDQTLRESAIDTLSLARDTKAARTDDAFALRIFTIFRALSIPDTPKPEAVHLKLYHEILPFLTHPIGAVRELATVYYYDLTGNTTNSIGHALPRMADKDRLQLSENTLALLKKGPTVFPSAQQKAAPVSTDDIFQQWSNHFVQGKAGIETAEVSQKFKSGILAHIFKLTAFDPQGPEAAVYKAHVQNTAIRMLIKNADHAYQLWSRRFNAITTPDDPALADMLAEISKLLPPLSSIKSTEKLKKTLDQTILDLNALSANIVKRQNEGKSVFSALLNT